MGIVRDIRQGQNQAWLPTHSSKKLSLLEIDPIGQNMLWNNNSNNTEFI